MKGQALRRQRVELGATAEQVAEYAGVDPGVLQEWERLDLRIPRAEAARVRMALYMLRSEQVMARSGLPDCEWVAGLEEAPAPEALEEHARSCDACRARTEYARKHGPRMPGTIGIVMSVMGPAERLSGPLRSAYLGFAMVLMITGIPLAGMLVLGLVTLDGEVLLDAAALLAATIGGGAAGGISHYYTGPLRRLGAAGHYGSWILTVYGYLAGLLGVAWAGVSVLGGASIAGDAREVLDMVGDPVGLVIFLVLGAIFGMIAGRGAREGPELEPETAAAAGSVAWQGPGSSPEPEPHLAPEPEPRDKGELAPILMIGSGVVMTGVLAAALLFGWHQGPLPAPGFPTAPPPTPDQARALLPELEAATDSLPDDPEALYRYGLALAQAEEHEQALGPLARAEELAPGDPNVANAYGWSLLQLGRIDEAIPRFRRALAADPSYETALHNLANALTARGDVDEAINRYRQALEVNPESPGVNTMLARLLASRRSFEAALPHIETAMATGAGEALTEETYARVLLGLARVDDALAHYREAARLAPDEPWYWRELGRMAHMLGRYEEANRAFARVDTLMPQYFASYAEDRRLWEEARQALGVDR